MTCALFFSNLRLNTENIQKLLLSLIAPTLGVATIAIYSTTTTEKLVFGEGSNLVTSGGFGPNQVSATLGLGVLAAWMFIIIGKTKWWLKLIIFASMGVLAVQSALTFSRGGLYNAVGSILIGSLFLMRDATSRIKLILVFAAIFVVTSYVILPRLEDFTGGALSNRFSNTDASGRSEIVMADLDIWKENPLLGIGPGMAKGARGLYYSRAGTNSAHTEFTRLLSEHGSLGLCAFLILLVMGIKNLRRARTNKGRAVVASMLGWSFLYMLNAAMRLVAPAFIFGIIFTTIHDKPASTGRRLKANRRRAAFPYHMTGKTRVETQQKEILGRVNGFNTETE